jgi:hypothetical protein
MCCTKASNPHISWTCLNQATSDKQLSKCSIELDGFEKGHTNAACRSRKLGLRMIQAKTACPHYGSLDGSDIDAYRPGLGLTRQHGIVGIKMISVMRPI